MNLHLFQAATVCARPTESAGMTELPSDPGHQIAFSNAGDSSPLAAALRNSAFERRALNPQPLPPEPPPEGWQGLMNSLIDSVALNPQPLPPGRTRWLEVALNPQPLPPEPPDSGPRQLQNMLDTTALNPQPLPPELPDMNRRFDTGLG
jgi:hypothetical protein